MRCIQRNAKRSEPLLQACLEIAICNKANIALIQELSRDRITHQGFRIYGPGQTRVAIRIDSKVNFNVR